MAEREIAFKNPRHVISAVTSKQWPTTELVEIALAGRSNVGKSSLINALAGRRALAYVGARPGKTRFLNFYNFDDDYMMVDTPGYGYASRSKSEIENFGSMIDEYFSSRENLKLCMIVVDIRHEASRNDVIMTKYLDEIGIPYLVILTKADKLSKSKRKEQQKIIAKGLGVPIEDTIIFSAKDQGNTDEIWKVAHRILPEKEED